MSRSVSAAPGERVGSVTVRLALRVRQVRFDREKAVAVAEADLKRSLNADQALSGVKGDMANIVVEEADPKANRASIRLELSGKSGMSADSPLFDAEKLRGMSLGSVQAYFENIDDIERVDVAFFPPWPRRMPDLKDHIEFRVQE
jgi:hypothetical protein